MILRPLHRPALRRGSRSGTKRSGTKRSGGHTGLYYYRARYYSPALGRFLQVDPIGYEDQMNLYAYVTNDPVNRIDPTGEFGIFGAIIGAGLELADQISSGDWRSASAEQIIKNFGKIGVSSGMGAVTGGVANLVKAAGTGAKVYTMASTGLKAGALGSLTKQAIDGNGIDGGKVITDGLTEAASAGVGAITEGAGLVAEIQGEAIVQATAKAPDMLGLRLNHSQYARIVARATAERKFRLSLS